MLSDIALPRDPLLSGHATTKNYVDLRDALYQTYSSSAPSSPILGGLWTDTSASPQLFLKQWNGSGWVTLADTNTLTSTADFVNVSGDAMTGFLTLHADPTSALHAATKQYVDITAQGFTFKNAVRVVATTNVTLSGLQTIDGITVVTGNRILVAGNSNAAENGIYVAASGAWTRSTDTDASGELADGALVPVAQGTTFADTQFICTATSADPWVPGSSTSTWTRFSGLQDLIAGNGLTKTGNQLDFVAGNATLTVAADSVVVASAPKWTTTRTISLTGPVTGSALIDGTGDITISTTSSAGTTKYTQTITGGSTTETITHNLGTKDVIVQLYEVSTGNSVGCDISRPTINTITLGFAVAPGAGAYRVVVV